MLGAIFRVLFGFIIACLAAGVVKVLFALTPNELMNATDDLQWRALDWMLLTATHSAVFTAPFALVAAAIGEWQNIRSWTYYALAGIAIALIGFVAQHMSETTDTASIVNNYALAAYLTTGFIAGLVYWMFAGRKAGDDVRQLETLAATGTGGSARSTTPAKPAATTTASAAGAGGAAKPAASKR